MEQEVAQLRTEVTALKESTRSQCDALQETVRGGEAETERVREAADTRTAELAEARARIAELEVRGVEPLPSLLLCLAG